MCRHGIAELMNWMMGGLNMEGQYAQGTHTYWPRITVQYPANVYALTVQKEIRNIKPICQFFFTKDKNAYVKD
jgi:hypothetical protein